MSKLTVYAFIEDFDNSELPDYDRREQLREAVLDYNSEYEEDYDPDLVVAEYERQKHLKWLGDF